MTSRRATSRARSYARAAKHILPHLKTRPTSLVRGPEGVQGELFFQKHDKGLRIPGMKLLDPSFDPGHAPLIEIPNRNALLGAAQMNVIEFHTWNATTRAIETPDRMTFDLDPGSGVRWAQVQEAAQAVRVLLQELDLPAFLKTSGGKGLHVVEPIRPALGWTAVKALSQAIVQHLATTLPQRFVSKSGPKNRVGKIFIDYLRNGRGATTACAWSVRARPGMGVSVPMDWSELAQLSSGAHWTLRTIDERLCIKDAWDAWPRTLRERPTLTPAMRALDFVAQDTSPQEKPMARYGKKAADEVEKAVHEEKRGQLKSGKSGKTVKSRKQAIAIGLSKARQAGGKVPKKKVGAKKTASKKTASRKTTSKKTAKRSSKKSTKKSS